MVWRNLVQSMAMLVILWNIGRMIFIPSLWIFAIFNILEFAFSLRSLRHTPKRLSDSAMAWLAAVILSVYPTLTVFVPHIIIHSSRAFVAIGETVQVLAVALEIAAIATLRRSFTVLPEAHAIVTKGLYRVVRHPLYAAYIVALIGVCLEVAAWPMFLFTGIYIALQVIRARAEEAVLLASFAEYRLYRAQTGMFFPRLGRHVAAKI